MIEVKLLIAIAAALVSSRGQIAGDSGYFSDRTNTEFRTDSPSRRHIQTEAKMICENCQINEREEPFDWCTECF